MEQRRDLIALEPSLESMIAARQQALIAQQKASASRIFLYPLPDTLGHCSCAECADVGGDRPQFCCRSLLSPSSSLSRNGSKMRDYFLSMDEELWNGCITSHSSFVSLYGDSEVMTDPQI